MGTIGKYIASAISLLLLTALTACASVEPTPASVPAPAGNFMEKVLGPIDGVEIVIAKSNPPQYFALINSGLPNGCVQFDGWTKVREGDTVKVTVTNLQPIEKNIVCTEVYGIVESYIALGSDYETGKTYTLIVNGVTRTFGSGVVPTPVPYDITAKLDTMFRLPVGKVAILPEEEITVNFEEILEDSRCAVNVECVWAGQARIQVKVAVKGSTAAVYDLELGAGGGCGIVETADGYAIRFLKLDPYPGTENSDQTGKAPPYMAFLMVSKSP